MANGATVVANTNHTMLSSNDYNSVNCNVTATFTGRSTGLIVANHGMGGLRRTGGRLRTGCNVHILPIRTSIYTNASGRTAIRGIIGRTISAFNNVRILIGGTRTSTSNIPLTRRAARRFSLTLCSNLCTTFCCVGTYCPCLTGSGNDIVGFTSNTNLFNGFNRYSCTTTGRNVHNLSHITTAR